MRRLFNANRAEALLVLSANRVERQRPLNATQDCRQVHPANQEPARLVVCVDRVEQQQAGNVERVDQQQVDVKLVAHLFNCLFAVHASSETE